MTTESLLENDKTTDPPPHRRSIPHSLELTVLFREFAHYWTGLKTEIPVKKIPREMADPMECTVRWTGSVRGTLVLRCSRTLVDRWMGIFREKGMEVQDGGAVYREMASLYAIFLAHFMWSNEFYELGPLLSRPSTPKDWPAEEPQSSCAVEVDGEPVEIKLWLKCD